MTLLQIKYLAAVAETGNISKAANNLFVSRPTISRAIHDIEEEFGLPLFIRTSSGLQLTEDGKYLNEKCLEILHRSEVLETQMHSIREKLMPTASRTVKICITPATSITLFPKMYSELQAEFPDIDVVTMEYSHLQARGMLEDGSIDFHLASDIKLGSLPPNFRYLELQTNDFVLYVSSNHHLAGKTVVNVDDIKDEPIACFDQYYYYESYLESRYIEKGLVPNIVFRSFQLSAIREMVASGLASTAMMRGVLDDGINIVALPLDPPCKWVTGLVWNSAVPHNTAFDDFLTFSRGFVSRGSADKPSGLSEENAL